MCLQTEYSVNTKNLSVEIRGSFVNVMCFFDFNENVVPAMPMILKQEGK